MYRARGSIALSPARDAMHHIIPDNWDQTKTVSVFDGDSDVSMIDIPPSRTDLASIPKALQLVFSITGKSQRAAVVHDYLYRGGFFDRLTCDRIFRDIMKQDGVGWRGWWMYKGVRLGGASSYKG